MAMDDTERLRWLQERLYRPKEIVRARQLTDGKWEIFDGVKTVTVTDEYFKENYDLCAQTQKLVKYPNGKQYEYHRS